MLKKQFFLIALLLVTVSLSATTVMAAGGAKQSPFLITGKLPHLTKILMQQWENPELKLTEDQKVKLLEVRKKTMTGAKKFGKEVAGLEKKVVKGALGGKSPEELRALVNEIAAIKASATMLHLQCIYTTSNILDQRQLEVLKK